MSEYWYDRPTLAEAIGEAPDRGLSFIPGVDFDPDDEDDRAAVSLAMEQDLHDRMQVLERENALLRAQLRESDEDE